jgi:hypothetical protein
MTPVKLSVAPALKNPRVIKGQRTGQKQQSERAPAPIDGVAKGRRDNAKRASGHRKLQQQRRKEREHELNPETQPPQNTHGSDQFPHDFGARRSGDRAAHLQRRDAAFRRGAVSRQHSAGEAGIGETIGDHQPDVKGSETAEPKSRDPVSVSEQLRQTVVRFSPRRQRRSPQQHRRRGENQPQITAGDHDREREIDQRVHRCASPSPPARRLRRIGRRTEQKPR